MSQHISRHKIQLLRMIPFLDEQPAMFACAVLACIMYYNSMRNRTYLKRKAELPPSKSPWAYLYRNADDLSFLHLTVVAAGLREVEGYPVR